LEFFANNIAVAHENLKLRDFVKESQKELSYVIGEAVEMRSKETGSHVKRVAHGSYLLAKLAGLSEYDAEMIKLASPLHDVGKVGIPDLILNKPGKHDDNEWAIMKTHAEIGYEMLSKSDNPILALGAQIAYQHHEKWDGTGYPRGLSGKNIDISGRITAIIDVFDALGSVRCYKQAWQDSEIQALIRKQSGAHFDPNLARLLLDNLEQFHAIREAFPDTH
jgi:response regulator RpfG family c-di-GMP phosphodiesterase